MLFAFEGSKLFCICATALESYKRAIQIVSFKSFACFIRCSKVASCPGSPISLPDSKASPCS